MKLTLITIVFALSISANVFGQSSAATTGTHLNTATDRSGTFEYTNLRSGSYFIEVKANGFSVFTSEEIRFTRGENKQLALELKVAAINASVVVTATGTAQ